MKTIVFVVLGSIAFVARVSHADQCMYFEDRAIAERAVAALTAHPRVVSFCEPCGDEVPGVPYDVSSTQIAAPNPGFHEVIVNDGPIDLAYTYVQTPAARFTNLALLAGCPTEGVSPELRVDATSATGVLITPHATAEAAPPSEPSPSPAAPAPPYVFYIIQPDQRATMVAFATGFGSAALAFTLCIFSLRRRRRHHIPRLVDAQPKSKQTVTPESV